MNRNLVCTICFGNITEEYLVTEMMLGTGDKFQYGLCSSCGCLQILNKPIDLNKYYPSNYYSLDNNPEIFFEGKTKAFLKRNRDFYVITGKGVLGKLLQRLMPNHAIELFNFRQIALNKKDKILDVGSGAGIIPYTFKNAGFRNISGIDPFLEKDIVYSNGLIIEKKSLFEMNKHDWDMIMFNHSFEHVSEPKEYLIKVSSLLKSGGHCVIRIPTVTSYAWENYKEFWVQLDAPRHFFLHSIQSIQFLADKTGFNYVSTAYESTAFQFIGSEQYKMKIPLFGDARSYYSGNKNLFTAEQIHFFTSEAKSLNDKRLGDSISIILQKK